MFISGRVLLKTKPLTHLLEVFSTTFPCQALKQLWKLMVVAGIPAALGPCGVWWAAEARMRHRELCRQQLKPPPNHTHTGNLVLPQWQLPSHSSPVLSRATGHNWCLQDWPAGPGCREVIPYRGEELKKYVPKGYGVTGLKHHVLLEVHQGDVCVIKGDFISSRL